MNTKEKENMPMKREMLRELKKFVLPKAKIKFGDSGDNIKLGNMGSWAVLPGDMDWYIPNLKMWVKGTCGSHCKGCFDPENPRCSKCYVFKAIVRKTNRNADGTVGDIVMNDCTVKRGHAYRTIAITLFRRELLESLDKQLTNYKGNTRLIRLNESGEFTCYEDLAMWCELASKHGKFTFYVYTKNYRVVKRAIANGIIPKNLFINISVWHKKGIKPYQEMESNSQIRCFAYVDKEWDVNKYAKNGLILQSMCGAYDKKGKMNHNVTCDKCKKCASRVNKCVGCFEH